LLLVSSSKTHSPGSPITGGTPEGVAAAGVGERGAIRRGVEDGGGAAAGGGGGVAVAGLRKNKKTDLHH